MYIGEVDTAQSDGHLLEVIVGEVEQDQIKQVVEHQTRPLETGRITQQ